MKKLLGFFRDARVRHRIGASIEYGLVSFVIGVFVIAGGGKLAEKYGKQPTNPPAVLMSQQGR